MKFYFRNLRRLLSTENRARWHAAAQYSKPRPIDYAMKGEAPINPGSPPFLFPIVPSFSYKLSKKNNYMFIPVNYKLFLLCFRYQYHRIRQLFYRCYYLHHPSFTYMVSPLNGTKTDTKSPSQSSVISPSISTFLLCVPFSRFIGRSGRI